MARILFLVTEGSYFLSHRLPVAKAAQQAGHDVVVLTVPGRDRNTILKEGFRLRSLSHMTRAGLNPFSQIRAIREIYKVYQKENPDIVHHVAMKPVVLGTIAALFSKTPKVINALTGLGYVFISKKIHIRALKHVLMWFFHFFLRGKKKILILQNTDDYHYFSEILPQKNLVLIKGSGVDVKKFLPRKYKESGKISCLLGARMLWDKGIRETVEAFRILKAEGAPVELILAGKVDHTNPSAIPEKTLKKWQKENLCIWKGHVEDMGSLLREVEIAILPSYREGLPKFLLEAGAAGLPIITADVPGCREIIKDEKNGLLVPPHEVEPLVSAVRKLVHDPKLRKKYGMAVRKDIEKYFSIDVVVEKTLKLYASK